MIPSELSENMAPDCLPGMGRPDLCSHGEGEGGKIRREIHGWDDAPIPVLAEIPVLPIPDLLPIALEIATYIIDYYIYIYVYHIVIHW